MNVLMRAMLMVIAAWTCAMGATLTVVAVKGDVFVRHNVQEDWIPVARGDVLKPDDSIRSGKHASATIAVEGAANVSIPELVIVDLSDLRQIPTEDLILELTMESVRTLPAGRPEEELTLPRTTTVHGANRDAHPGSVVPDDAAAAMQLDGAQVLYTNGYYATCVLKARQVFRRHRDLLGRVDRRLMVAQALEKLKLDGEAKDEYISLSRESLSPDQKAVVTEKIDQLSR